jgi:predicted nucleotidyltransferase
MKCTPVLFYSLPEGLTRDQNIAIILAGGTWTLLHLIHVLDKGGWRFEAGKEEAGMTKPIRDIQQAYPPDVAHDLARAVAILKAGGCREIYLFGSTATGDRHAGSDIDLAVRGCPPHAFFQLLGQLLSDLDHPVDLVDLDLPGPFVEALLRSETLVYLG